MQETNSNYTTEEESHDDVEPNMDCEYRGPETGETALLRSLLQRAVLDLNNTNPTISKDALDWFNEPLDKSNPEITSYQFITALIGLEPSGLRKRIFLEAQEKREKKLNSEDLETEDDLDLNEELHVLTVE